MHTLSDGKTVFGTTPTACLQAQKKQQESSLTIRV